MTKTRTSITPAVAKKQPRARAITSGTAKLPPQREVPGGKATFYSSSDARKHWSEITKRALGGEKIAIILGTRAMVLQEVSLSYAEMEYGINEQQIHAKSQEVESRATREIASGKARKIM